MPCQAKKSTYCYHPVNPYDQTHTNLHLIVTRNLAHQAAQKPGGQEQRKLHNELAFYKFSRMRRPPRRKASSSSSYAHKQCAEHIACVHLPSCHHHQVSRGQQRSPHLLRINSHSPKTLPSLSGPPSPPLTAGEGSGPSWESGEAISADWEVVPTSCVDRSWPRESRGGSGPRLPGQGCWGSWCGSEQMLFPT